MSALEHDGGVRKPGGAPAADDLDVDVSKLPFPPLPDPVPPEGSHELYQAITEMRRLLEVANNEQMVRQQLLAAPEITAAILQMLHESNLLKRRREETPAQASSAAPSAATRAELENVPLPRCPAPPLPAGHRSWIVAAPGPAGPSPADAPQWGTAPTRPRGF